MSAVPEHPATRIKTNGLCRIQPQNGRATAASPKAASWYQVTLAAIGDAVLTTDPDGRVTYMNPVAETLTGWSAAEALGKRLEDVFRIVNEETRKPVEQPVRKVIDTGLVRGLANHTLLIARDGSELPIDDSAAPVWGEDGEPRRRRHGLPGHHGTQAEPSTSSRRPGDTPRASSTRCETRCSSSTPTSTSGRRTAPSTRCSGSSRPRPKAGSSTTSATASGTSRPSGPCWRKSSPRTAHFDDFEVEHDFEAIGPKTMLLNARRFPPEGKWELILLAIADITERKRLEVEREGLLRGRRGGTRQGRGGCGQARRRRPPQERVPGDARPRAEEPARRRPERRRRSPPARARRRTSNGAGTSPPGRSRNFAHLINDLLDVSRITEGKIQLHKELIDAGPGHPPRRRGREAARRGAEARAAALVHVHRPEARGRPDPAGADARQPPHERRQVHAVRGPHPAHRRGRRGRGRLPRAGQRGRHPARAAPADVRPLRPGRPLARPLGGGARHRADARPVAGRAARRHRHRDERRPRQGERVRRPAPRRRRPARGRIRWRRRSPTASAARRFRVLVVDDNVDTANGMARLLEALGPRGPGRP